MKADYIIIGGGSAGCVLAARFSEDPAVSVILLEAGGEDLNPLIHVPAGYIKTMVNPAINWMFETEPHEASNNRWIKQPRGKVLGGSSSINGMVYARGHAKDFARWEALGAQGWGYDAVLPYFKKAQGSRSGSRAELARGFEGPLTTTDGVMTNPLYGHFIEAAQQAGYPYRADLNDGEQEGFGPLPMTVADGIRQSSVRAYLPKSRPNLRILKNSLVTKIDIQGGAACAIELKNRRQRLRVEASQEVILSAGAINSPQLLMLSGIGAADQLRQLGINAIVDAPNVGKNLMDHLEVYVQQACTQPLSLYKDLGLMGRAKIGLRWLYDQRGLGATNHFEAGGFIRSSDSRTQIFSFIFCLRRCPTTAAVRRNSMAFRPTLDPCCRAVAVP